MKDNTVTIFGFRGSERDLDRLEAVAQLQVDAPLRLAYEPRTNSVGIVSFESNAGDKVNFHRFDAASHMLRKQTTLVSARRGRINSEGLAAVNGVFRRLRQPDSDDRGPGQPRRAGRTPAASLLSAASLCDANSDEGVQGSRVYRQKQLERRHLSCHAAQPR
jgi:hypothetical protein